MSRESLQDVLTITHRNLPHWEAGGSVYFVTFRSLRGALPNEALELTEKRIYAGHGKWFTLFLGVLMPDHAHLIIQPLPTGKTGFQKNDPLPRMTYFGLGDILKGIKGASARDINLHLVTQGSVWQSDRFDRILRNEKEYLEKYRYILYNPVKASLIQPWEEYRFYLRPEYAEARKGMY
jgi:REP element-mobilizing transposase RayT